MRFFRLFTVLLALSLVLSSCGITVDPNTDTQSHSSDTPTTEDKVSHVVTGDDSHFSKRDLDPSYEEKDAAVITLSGSTAQSSSNAVIIDGSTITITDEGTYLLTGNLNNGTIVVNTDKSKKVQLVLRGVTIHSENSAPIYIYQSDKVFITLDTNTENHLSNGGSFSSTDETNIDSVIFSKEDLTLNGSGSLTIDSPSGHGIVSKDSLVITGGNYRINAAGHGITGKDDVCIAAGNFTIDCEKDGIHSENDDENLGYLYIQDGTFAITSECDGITASGWMQILDGQYTITAGGGSVNGTSSSKDPFGWGGGMGGFGGRPGGPGGIGGMCGQNDNTASENTVSTKAFKAAGTLEIFGGSFVIDCADDAFHSNADLIVSGGQFTIQTGDDGFHADENLQILDGTILISESYEGLEGHYVTVAGGNISLTASDDGINAAGGADQSGYGGPMGNDRFGGGKGGFGGMGGASDGSITITGGNITITASGDGVDANGTLTITGGYIIVCGPNSGDTATLDFDVSGVITGGTFIGTGASQMAQTFSSSEQGVIAVSVGSQAAETLITLTDANGNMVISRAPELPFSVVILSSPDIKKGEKYTITVGVASGVFEAQ